MGKKLTLTSIFISALLGISGIIDLNAPFNYANVRYPFYITKDNTPPDNPISNEGATLGRVLFYDKKLSVNNTISCASCHQQQFAFSDTAVLSRGVGGQTGRHSMRLVNARFSNDSRFFWDKRAQTLEQQITFPITDRAEMGFSGVDGAPDLDSLLRKLANTNYYPTLFQWAFGTPDITRERIEKAVAQFIRSIASFDTRYDMGRSKVANDFQPFPNFTDAENEGKQLFMTIPSQGGAGCFRCHLPPEFSIDPNTLNNGVVEVAGQPDAIDMSNTRAPSLRDLVNPNGQPNGPMMHTGAFSQLHLAINHYNYLLPNPANTQLDPRLAGPHNAIPISKVQKDKLEKFLRTLTGYKIYTDEKWSDPFEPDGSIEIVPLISKTAAALAKIQWSVAPNPTTNYVHIALPDDSGNYQISVFDAAGKWAATIQPTTRQHTFYLDGFPAGIFTFQIFDKKTGKTASKRVVKLAE